MLNTRKLKRILLVFLIALAIANAHPSALALSFNMPKIKIKEISYEDDLTCVTLLIKYKGEKQYVTVETSSLTPIVTVDYDLENHVVKVYVLPNLGGELIEVANFQIGDWTVIIYVDPPGGTEGPIGSGDD